MCGWLARFHGDNPGLYTVSAARRTAMSAGGLMRRLIIEAAMFQPRRRGAPSEWLLIYWCIDGPGVAFHRCMTQEITLTRLRLEPSEQDIVYSLPPL